MNLLMSRLTAIVAVALFLLAPHKAQNLQVAKHADDFNEPPHVHVEGQTIGQIID
jgi:hypothetical protein